MSSKQYIAYIVEDDPLSAEIYVAAIEGAGYQTELFEDGQAALDRLQQESDPSPHLLVLDLRLPNVSGNEILAYVVSQQRFNDLQIIVSSADSFVGEVKKYKNRHNLVILQKPISFPELRTLAAGMRPQN